MHHGRPFTKALQFAGKRSRLLLFSTTTSLDLSDLGGHTFAVSGVPAGIEGIDPVQLLRQMVSDTRHSADSFHAQLALSLARSAAIPYGQLLSNEEMENVINELFTCSNVNYTPDGKAILCILPQGDIEQLLG